VFRDHIQNSLLLDCNSLEVQTCRGGTTTRYDSIRHACSKMRLLARKRTSSNYDKEEEQDDDVDDEEENGEAGGKTKPKQVKKTTAARSTNNKTKNKAAALSKSELTSTNRMVSSSVTAAKKKKKKKSEKGKPADTKNLSWREALRTKASDEQEFDRLMKTNVFDDPTVSESQWFSNLKQGKHIRTLRGNVKVIQFPDPVGIDADKTIAPNVLFVRSFYEDLLRVIRLYPALVLVGNPGISKSFFQYYYMWRMLNTDEFGALPPDYWGNTEPPEVVVRQIGKLKSIVYDVKRLEALEVFHVHTPAVVDAFNSVNNLYLFEPGASSEQPYFEGLKIPTVATVPPNPVRYKEFVKNRAQMTYMPAYEEEELLGIGDFLRENDLVPSGMEEEYSEEKIKDRYETFGGIMRQVFPATINDKTLHMKTQTLAIGNCEFSRLLSLNSAALDAAEVSSDVMQYDVDKTGDDAFRVRGVRLSFVSNKVLEKLHELQGAFNLDDMVLTLQHDDYLKQHHASCEKIMEDLFSLYVTSGEGVEWRQRCVKMAEEEEEGSEGQGEGKGIGDPWELFTLKLQDIDRSKLLPYHMMPKNVLYYPLKTNFPAVDCYYKNDAGCIVAFQITRQRSPVKELKLSALAKFCDEIGLLESMAADTATPTNPNPLPVPSNERLHLVLVPHPSQADRARISYTAVDEKELHDTRLKTATCSYTVLAVNERYARKSNSCD